MAKSWLLAALAMVCCGGWSPAQSAPDLGWPNYGNNAGRMRYCPKTATSYGSMTPMSTTAMTTPKFLPAESPYLQENLGWPFYLPAAIKG